LPIIYIKLTINLRPKYSFAHNKRLCYIKELKTRPCNLSTPSLKNILLFLFVSFPCLFISSLHAQTLTANHTHSHNDYKQDIPFFKAYYASSGSIEADVYLLNGTLYVAHERKEITASRTLNELYLKPLAALFRKNNGMAYPDPSKTLQLVIDIKEDYIHVIPQLIKDLALYQDVFNTTANKNSVKIVLSGNMPEPAMFKNYPAYIYYDGRPYNTYSIDQLEHIAMISDNLADYTQWNGTESLTAPDSVKLQKLVNSAHAQHKPFRFWATHDSPNTWIQLEKLGVDWINTDHPELVHDFYTNRFKQ
jgi:alkaline phosphatase